ncbi:hypothetical protein Runsl_2247 [Runella slithyformis DSM 19594]|uniref:Uncharacterized protein n=1 Tax=Runella slithyformis (strain ATCC 29530 / DSM 19594 / LMG 11500 / NCIMB 11436 / LSU 4) TaxID=761193 RepID=A0A7U4E5Z2_RUNSL|nr:hypothetical protein Runsl_2247 [Runella slithyformis DSM 19594]
MIFFELPVKKAYLHLLKTEYAPTGRIFGQNQ